ncbi:hypothetical protein NKH41_03340 [Mesorhizobium sp. M1169]|uniref:hypothetical protein n=1 Tax=unclassified Mesorhizobium TaxID=325217 RepID=UPI00333B6024
MKTSRVAEALNRILDRLAGIEHERWSHWQRYMHDKGTRQPDGSLIIPAALVERWEKQIATPFADLTNVEKESDRDQVRKYLPAIVEALSEV